MKKDETDPIAWYRKGVALANLKRVQEAIDAHSIGISYAPFSPINYFGRGRRHNALGEWREAIADFTLCIQLDPQNWFYHYYRATTLSLMDRVEDCIPDFLECLKLTAEAPFSTIRNLYYVFIPINSGKIGIYRVFCYKNNFFKNV